MFRRAIVREGVREISGARWFLPTPISRTSSAELARSERNRRGPPHRRRPVRRGRTDQRSAAAGRALPLGLSVVESAGLPPAEDPPDAEPTPRPGGELGHPFGAGASSRRRRTAGPGLPPLAGRPAASPSHPAARGEPAMRAALYARVV